MRANAPSVLRAIVLCAGWCALLVVAALFAAEQSGALTSWVNRRFRGYLDPVDERLTVERVSIDWLRPALRLDGLRLGEDGADLELRELVLVPDLALAGLDHVELRGGRATLSRDLRARVRRWIDIFVPGAEDRDSDDRATGTAPPLRSFVVTDLEVELSPRAGETWPIGSLDVRFTGGGDEPSRLSGRLSPAAWWSGARDGEVVLAGSEVEPGILEVRTLLRDLEFGMRDLPPGFPLEELRPLHPSARASLEVWGRLALDGSAPPTGRVRAHVFDGELVPPGLADPVSGLALDVDADFTPSGDDFVFDLPAWNGRAKLTGRWRDVEFDSRLSFGDRAPASSQMEAWIHLPRATVREAEVSDWIALCQGQHGVRYPLEQLAARGTADVFVALGLPRGWRARDGLARNVSNLVHVRADGEVSLAYEGPRAEDGTIDRGFPLRVEKARGDVLSSFEPSLEQPGLIGIVDVHGTAGATVDNVRATGLIGTPPPALRTNQWPDVEVRVRATDLIVDEKMREAARGLRRWVPESSLWERYQPSAGSADLDLRIVGDARIPHTAVSIAVDLEDGALAWSPLPLPFVGARGRVLYVGNGRGRWGLVARASGKLRTAEAVDLRLRVESDEPPDRASSEGTSAPVSDVATALRVDVRDLSLRGDDLEIVAKTWPEVGRALEQVRPKGFVSLAATLGGHEAESETQLRVEIAPSRSVEVQPEVFQMTTRDLRGRLLVDARTSADGGTPGVWRIGVRALPLVGAWGADVPVALVGELASAGGSGLRLFGAGIDASDRRLLGSLSAAIAGQRGTDRSGAGIDLNALTLDGRVDFEAELGRAAAGSGADPAPREVGSSGSFELYLRDNDLASAQGFQLRDLAGRVRYDLDRGVLEGESLTAILGRTRVELDDTVISRDGDALRLEAKLDARSLPLDREHLSLFLSKETLTALLDELEGRGRIDVLGGQLLIMSYPDGRSRVELSGPLTLADLFVRLGVPLSIRSARGELQKLVVEGGNVRAWGKLEDLYGSFADRSLDRASMLLTYVQPRLSIEELSGAFIDDRGSVHALDGSRPGTERLDGDRATQAFAIDLLPPFPFQVSVGLRNVDVQGFTRGLFASNVANEGRLDGELILSGELHDLLGIRGSGYARIFDGRLWSVPVVRTVFTQLGLDDTAVFDQMSTRFEVEDGVIHMTEVRARSPILSLVGSGTLDFDGTLKHDLEVNYSLIDRLGPLTRLLYTIQNSLLRITIRGDMSRPKVILRGILSSLFGFDDAARELPLPDLSDLPDRF